MDKKQNATQNQKNDENIVYLVNAYIQIREAMLKCDPQVAKYLISAVFSYLCKDQWDKADWNNVRIPFQNAVKEQTGGHQPDTNEINAYRTLASTKASYDICKAEEKEYDIDGLKSELQECMQKYTEVFGLYDKGTMCSVFTGVYYKSLKDEESNGERYKIDTLAKLVQGRGSAREHFIKGFKIREWLVDKEFKEFNLDIKQNLKIEEGICDSNAGNRGKDMSNYSLNQILYGPPGTGKTYNSVIYAVSICGDIDLGEEYNLETYDLDKLQEKCKGDKDYYKQVLKRYNKLKNDKYIEFITFHQSYGYEEFIQGIA